VLVDPPRAGLDENTCKLISQFEKIVYISCNPETLARDVKMLLSTHTVQRVAAFDQFPYTHHLESGVFLVRRTDPAETAEADGEAERSEKKQRTV
jgi:tRNA (uracil-5-)-methyltransferase